MSLWTQYLLVIAALAGASRFQECSRGEKQVSITGQRCLNWLDATIRDNSSVSLDIESAWNHSFCRNPDNSEIQWCYVLTQEQRVQKQHCDRDKCTDTVQSPAQPDAGISQRVRMRPKKKKDLGVLGYVLGALLMTISLLLATGIIIGYCYKRGRSLIREQVQEACEREMQRNNLPLSAFSNPACDVLDESTVSAIVHEGPEAMGEKEEAKEVEEHHPGDKTSDAFGM